MRQVRQQLLLTAISRRLRRQFVDAFSKWLELRIVPSASSRAAIEVLRKRCGIHGLPDCIVTDNGTAFNAVSSRFERPSRTLGTNGERIFKKRLDWRLECSHSPSAVHAKIGNVFGPSEAVQS
uniref:Integrase catalytic domain-containing protein n=1 Tax=Trichuris muris TaxID=70415 RepID=A0A5S6PZ30_TRIMR